ncbi:MAG TPA: hypothetical protein VE338_16685 [Ktedonobacterales bacterium]|nr:hypothetical protein [Ktedonobacterales bacterium]
MSRVTRVVFDAGSIMLLWSELSQQAQQGFAHSLPSISQRAATPMAAATLMMGGSVAGRGAKAE